MSRISPIEVGYLASDFGLKDSKDCAVRALANVSNMKTYPEFRNRMAELGRRVNKGTPWKIINETYRESGVKQITLWGIMGWKYRNYIPHDCYSAKGITLKTFLMAHPVGRYVVMVRGHALAVVNGNIIDTASIKSGRRVFATYYFGE